MKIEDAWIDDPTLGGRLEVPKLCVQVDRMPDLTIPPEKFDGGWTVGKFGPFVQYVHVGSNAGDFNVRFRKTFPMVVDVSMFVGGKQETGRDGFSLTLPRARQLIRKYDDGWKLALSDREAIEGRFLWLPQQVRPVCRRYSATSKTLCGASHTTPIFISGIDLPLCPDHVRMHNTEMAALRHTTSK